MKINKPSYISSVIALICNLLLIYIIYMVCRVVYIAENWSSYSEGFAQLSVGSIIHGGLYFDTSAILYTNALYALLMLLPLHYKETRLWQCITKQIYLWINGIAIAMNLADAAYFKYSGHRVTMSVTGEFAHEDNLLKVFSVELLNHWYLVLVFVIIIICMIKAYVMPQQMAFTKGWKQYAKYYAIQLMCLLLFVPLCVAGMRGGFTTAVRPITISNANQYVNHPTEAAMVLNTPFSIIRTIGKNVFKDPEYFTPNQLNEIYSPVHNPSVTLKADKKNVVVLIVESFGREYIGEYNKQLDGGKYKGYTPFVDSLLQQSLTYEYTFANGRQSIDGMPSILSSIPRFIEPFFLTPASMNDVSGLAGELGKWGYQSAFFHGAENGSMGFEAFAKTTGYQKYYGRTEFNEDKRFRGDKDYDGTWAIWDKPFMQFYALKMSEMKQPFITSIFTASSHHPYVVPEEDKARYPEEGTNPIHKCIRYTDNAIREFFNTAKKQPWYKNTIFVFTSDHTNISDHPEYATDLGFYGAPLFFYDPSGKMPRGVRPGIAQQIDIMPTILDYLGYPNPYVAFGIDLLNTPAADTWAVQNGNGIYQFTKGDYVIQFDGNHITAAYNYKTDWMMKHDLHNDKQYAKVFAAMERQLKAIIQSYMQRMTTNKLVYS